MNDTADLRAWIGRTSQSEDLLRPEPARFFQATLDRVADLAAGGLLPPLWHWLYFLEAARARDLGRDAHPRRGGFLPPVALPRRMWAGGRFVFHAPLRLGQEAQKVSTIGDVVEKTGRSGPLCFVTVRHEIWQGGVLALREDHDIVYRADPDPAAPAPPSSVAPPAGRAEFSRQITPDPALLFRYSALTFNGHRIHYDADYARGVEGYAGLVVHGPLVATLLVDLAMAQAGQSPHWFAFRGLAPIAGMAPFVLEGRREGDVMQLWARRADGVCAMQAEARFDR